MEIITAIVALIITLYSSVFYYAFTKLRKLPREQRRKMSPAQLLLYIYGSSRVPVESLENTLDTKLSTFQVAWREMESIYSQFQESFEQKKQEFQKAENNLTKMQKQVEEQNQRLRSLSELTPDAASEVMQAILRSGKNSLRQQIIVSAVFFVLGSVTTLGVTILVI